MAIDYMNFTLNLNLHYHIVIHIKLKCFIYRFMNTNYLYMLKNLTDVI